MVHSVFIFEPNTSEEAKALKSFAKALKLKFHITKEKPYNPEFVKMILTARKEKGELLTDEYKKKLFQGV
jgi:hypothetical protein